MDEQEKQLKYAIEEAIRKSLTKGIDGKDILKCIACVVHEMQEQNLVSHHDLEQWAPFTPNYPGHTDHSEDLPHSEHQPGGEHQEAEPKHHHSKGYPPKYSKNPPPKGTY